MRIYSIKPGVYEIRLLFDSNKNGRYDTGSFLNRIEPERILYLNESIEIRANWEENRTYVIQKSNLNHQKERIIFQQFSS